ncbi:hypothetical protein H2199_003743 [Coniosporium tulheliwenetii]|uniref:Uncharacterized protein n=1 Tax=Coniosporium tulheliwenetii TaxID=3383036 RepID=A0ACC2ZBQ6_9PEZI|nr:hypothetical protein H2199_003743 [Cladosporium sp. JES 115]
MPSLLTHHPLKALYALFATALEAFRLPLYIVLYLLPSARPHPKWTYKQAVLIKLLKTFLHHAARIEIRMPLSLKPGREGERFVVMRAPEKEVLEKLYVGPLKDPHGEIVPGELGGTWYPSAYPSSSSKNASSEGKDTEDVVLYVHGGAFVLGTGRIYECGFIVSALLRHAGVHRVFCPQYRLAGRPLNARFPAALQDVLTSYLYLTRELGIPAKRVIVSGDSAGGNVAIGLLRYLAEYGAELDLESPAAALLWSPWVDPAAAVDPARFKQNPNYPTDFVPAVFLAWGIRCFSGRDEATGKPKLDPSNKYITP